MLGRKQRPVRSLVIVHVQADNVLCQVIDRPAFEVRKRLKFEVQRFFEAQACLDFEISHIGILLKVLTKYIICGLTNLLTNVSIMVYGSNMLTKEANP